MPSDHDLLLNLVAETRLQTKTLKEIKDDVKSLKKDVVAQDLRLSALENGIKVVGKVFAGAATLGGLFFSYLKLKGP